MYLKIHRSGDNVIVALCDRELIGKTLKEGDISITISEDFYKGDLVSEDRVRDTLAGAGNINIFGERSVSCAIECGVVDKDCVRFIDGVAHAQVFRI
ncbi:DUF424 family protein [Methanolobus zinderi]|jgi:hypothetical protein|uniref:DUF424 family protein n=1 Tax=Methanolobus zinderi TaxID=536044 RepID=A0A7D5EDH0_9EURY|nr:DUF424 family protein [Methanolobus zinderi]KXS45016.1 MAG: hypothetical protein AWU59_90 [Methanolobus sp. T82-4]QLC49456.1 DUF424 family protein [Methanolobus zinderi]